MQTLWVLPASCGRRCTTQRLALALTDLDSPGSWCLTVPTIHARAAAHAYGKPWASGPAEKHTELCFALAPTVLPGVYIPYWAPGLAVEGAGTRLHRGGRSHDAWLPCLGRLGPPRLWFCCCWAMRWAGTRCRNAGAGRSGGQSRLDWRMAFGTMDWREGKLTRVHMREPDVALGAAHVGALKSKRHVRGAASKKRCWTVNGSQR